MTTLPWTTRWSRLPWVWQIAICAVVYTGLAHLSMALAFPGSIASPVWLPSGMGVVLLILGGKRLWPAITAGALTANLLDFSAHGLLTSNHYLSASAIAVGNTMEACCATWLLQRTGNINALFRRVSDVLRFGVVCPLAAAISATVGVSGLVLTGIMPADVSSTIWVTRWLGDLTGMLLLIPFVLAWRLSNTTPFARRPWLEGLVLLALAWAIFSNPFGAVSHSRPFLLLLIPCLVWLTYRHGLRGGTTGTLALSASAVIAISQGRSLLEAGALNGILIQLDVLLVIFAVLVLLLGADLAQRRDAGSSVDWRALAIPWGALTFGCALTLLLWHLNASQIEHQTQARFVSQSQTIVRGLQARITDYQKIIQGGANLFLGRPSVSRDVWQDYVQSLQLTKTLPGVQGVGFAEVIMPARLAEHIQGIRANGFPTYGVRPAGPRDIYTSIIYLEPFDSRNQRAFGFDMFSEATRRAAMTLARDTGAISGSGKVKLVQENGQAEQAGFLIYSPVYSRQRNLDTPAARQAALIGYAYAPFRVDDLVNLAVSQQLDTLALELFDTTDTSEKNRLYPIVTKPRQVAPRNESTRYEGTIDIGQRTWAVRIHALPSFWQSVDHTSARLTLVFGLLLSVAMFLLLRLLARSKSQEQESAHFRSVIELAPSALIMVNQAGLIEMVNSPIERMFGHPRAALLGQPVEMLIPQRFHKDHPGFRLGFFSSAAARPMGKNRDLFGLRQDGSEIALEIALSPLLTETGSKVLCGFVDISARKTYEADLLKASRDLELTNSMAKVGGWEVNLVANTLHWSAETCRIHGLKPGYQPNLAEAIQFYAPEAQPVIQKAVEDAIASGTEWDLELPLITVDGEQVWVRSQGQAEYVDGIPVRLVGAFQDVTERKLHSDELTRQNKELDNFAYVASHDLKSPLRGIDQLATWLTEDLAGKIDAEAIEHLRLMRIRISRMENLLTGLLSYSRAGRVEGDPEHINMTQLVQDTFDLCLNQSGFQLNLVGDFPEIETTRVPLELVFRNLISNAIKHHDRQDGQITVAVRQSGNFLECDVADDGPGIAPEHTERAFGMFQTLRPRDEVEGSGIGLAIVKKTIEAFGGTIHLLPNMPRGALFRFTWPHKATLSPKDPAAAA